MRCCLIGEKLGHSYSKIIHDEFRKYDYELVELKPSEVADFVKGSKYDAFNVTIPYKQTIIPMLDFVDDAALSIGAVNTVVRRNGKTYGYNTDFDGMIYMLSYAGIDINGKNVTILGGGGTSKTSVAVAKHLGAASITVVSRSGPINYENCYYVPTDVIINATPVGMYPELNDCPIDLDRFNGLSGVVDVIYNPLNTRLISIARQKGIRVANGLMMLVAQAKFALDKFTGKNMPEYIVRRVYGKLIRRTQNIVIVGMPGSGKTSVGKSVAKLLGKPFVDLDKEIEKEAKMSITEIFEKYGEARFREIECIVAGKIGKENGKVIATGGGIVLNCENYYSLKANGIIIRIERDLDKLATFGRPLSKNVEALKEMYKIRSPLYEKFADYTVDNDGVFYECADKIMEILYENFGYQRR